MRSFERTNPVMLPDGNGVIMTGLAPGATVEDLLLVPLARERRLEVLFQAPGVERNPAMAPSGRFIAYDSDESRLPRSTCAPSRMPARESGKSPMGGAGPVWTRDGSEIVYQDSQGRMIAVAVRIDGNGEFHSSTPKVPVHATAGGDSGGLIAAGMSQPTASVSCLSREPASRREGRRPWKWFLSRTGPRS